MSPAGSASASDLTVEQYAGISAAIAEGYPLDAVLANEGLAPKAWPGEDTAWKQKLVADPATFESYRAKLGEAEDWLGREVTPLDDDLAAWMGFLGAYGAHQAPFDLLGGLGLKMGDLGRLQRRWQKRLATDEALAKQAVELAKQKPRTAPTVSAAKGVLKPFPWSKKGAPSAAAAPAPSAETSATEGDLDLDLDLNLASYAALAAELAVTPNERRRVLRRRGLDEPAFATLHARWDARIAADAALAQDYRRLFAHERVRVESAARSGKELPRVEAPAPVAAFAAHPDLAPIAAEMPSIVAVTAPARTPSKLAGTALAVDVPRGPALPFAKGIAPKEIAEGAPDEPRPKRSPLGGTALAVGAPHHAATPFEPENKAIPAPRAAPSKLAGTALAVDVPHGPALPFDPSASPSPAIASAPAPRPAPAGLGGTSLLVDVPRGLALPFARDDSRVKQPEIKAESAPSIAVAAPPRKKLGELKFGMEIPKNLPPPRSSYAPSLTLEQHASLAVELAVSPETAAATLARYRLTAEARAELDAHYHDKIAGSAETRAAWDRAYHAYSTWLAANRRSAR